MSRRFNRRAIDFTVAIRGGINAGCVIYNASAAAHTFTGWGIVDFQIESGAISNTNDEEIQRKK